VRVTNLVRTVSRIKSTSAEWLIAHMVQTRLTVEAYLTSKGVDNAGRKRWGSAFGRAVAKLSRAAGFEPVKTRVAIAQGSGWTEAYTYPSADFFYQAWHTPGTPKRKGEAGLSYEQKINGG
jgi:hypothetical protein